MYVDDRLVAGTNTTLVDQLFQDIHVLEAKDLRVVTKFLGMRVAYDDKNGYARSNISAFESCSPQLDLT